MTSKLAIFRRQAAVGARVTLRLSHGKDVSGRVTAIDDAYVSLDLGEKTVTYFDDLLAGFEIHRGDNADVASEDHGDGWSTVEAGDAARHDSAAENAVDGSDPPAHASTKSNDADSNVVVAVAQVQAAYDEALKRARVHAPEPDFSFPTSQFPSGAVDSVRREWDRAQNQYGYALKVKELARLSNIVTQVLEPLATRYPDSAAAKSLMGRVLLKLNHQSEARGHLAAAAALSDEPDHWLALAATTEQDTALECYALRRYFQLTPPWQAQDEWHRYLAGTIDHRDLREATRIIQAWSQRKAAKDDHDRLLSKSLIYLLSWSGHESLAHHVAANLVHASGELPAGWRDDYDPGVGPSDELLAVEREFSKPSVSRRSSRHDLNDDGSVSRGLIASFGNQRFGFITAHGNQSFFFRIDDIVDDNLRQVLLDGEWRTFGEVEFDILPAGHHRYSRAANVVRLQDNVTLLLRAQDLLQSSQHPQAMAIVRRVLRTDPKDEDALQLQEKIKHRIRRDGIGLPRGNGPYARAKRAQIVDQDLQRATDLLKQAIRQKNNLESAVKDLASLLQQQGRNEEGVTLLEEHARQTKGISPYDNILATQYQHADRHDDAVEVLTRLMRATAWPKKGTLLRRIAFSYFKLARYEDAEKSFREILDNNPSDTIAQRWLVNLEDVRQAGNYDDADEISDELGTLTEEGVVLSSLAHAAIEHCSYEGVDPARLQAGSADHKDAKRVADLARHLGTKRPRDRAAYYLAAAALLKRNPRDGDQERIYRYLLRYFASMADASWFEKRPADVIRSYYIESLSLVFDDRISDAWRSLLRYLATFSPGILNEAESMLTELKDRSGPGYQNALRKTLTLIEPSDEKAWLEGLLILGSQSSFARDQIGALIRTDQVLMARFTKLLRTTGADRTTVQQTWQSRCRDHARSYQRRLALCRTLTNHQATVASMEDLVDQLRKATEETTSEVDRARLKALGDTADSTLGFFRASDFEERERSYWMVTTEAKHIREDIIQAPTRYSHEGLLPVADHLRSLIEQEYAQTVQTSGADLRLQLLVDRYHRRKDGVLRLQIEVSNNRGCSPASTVRLLVGPTDSTYFNADYSEVVPTLRGGDAIVTQIVVHPQPTALKDRAFPIEVTATYRNLLGEDRRTESQEWTVRLYEDEEFEHISNPYAPYAEGGPVPVDDSDMFVGREDMLERLKNALLAGAGSKSIVMFGQKRAGKSSLLGHLSQLLDQVEGVVPVSFSLQELAPELSIPALLHRILHGIDEALEELRLEGAEIPDFSPPGIVDLQSHATSRFHETMASLLRTMERTPFRPRFVLLVDEFTDIFKEIRNDRIPRQFMKAWKAIIEKRYFASVLVGQDIMPAFKDEFPNEFGVTEDVRVTYLDDDAAATLVKQPVGEHRFVGNAVSGLLELTACSPYYTMMFCARLVDYMNDTRSAIVTEADIVTVKNRMLRGDRRLTRDKFDNLLCAGDGEADSGIDPEDTHAVCLAIAQGSEKGWCPRSHISTSNGTADVDSLLLDLENRDVVECRGETYRLRVGLFRDWLLL